MFEEIQDKWLSDFKQFAVSDGKFILIGNKADLEGKRNVTTEQGSALAEEIGTQIFLETSAKTGENVEDASYHL